jgi:hypothetical protein
MMMMYYCTVRSVTCGEKTQLVRVAGVRGRIMDYWMLQGALSAA